MANDGRAFFATSDALVPQDTNGAVDVYEYVDGRPQLITTGTAASDAQGSATPQPHRAWSGQRQRHRRLLLDLRHPGPAGPQRPLPQVLRRPHQRRLPRRPAAAPVRSGRRVPRRSTTQPTPPRSSARNTWAPAATLPDRKPRSRRKKKKHKKAHRRKPRQGKRHHHGGHAMAEREHGLPGPDHRRPRRPGARRRSRRGVRRCRAPTPKRRSTASQPCHRPPRPAATRISRSMSRSTTGSAARFRPRAATARTRRTSTSHLPTGFIGDPHAAPKCTVADFANMSARPSARSARGPAQRRIGADGFGGSRRSTTWSRIRTRPVCSASTSRSSSPRLHRPQRADRQRLRAQRDGDRTSPTCSRSAFSKSPLGVPASPEHDVTPADPVPIGTPCLRSATRIPAAPPSRTAPLDARSSRTRPPATPGPAPRSVSDVLSYDRGVDQPRRPGRQTTGCDQLSFNPSLYAQPTTTETDTASGLDVDLKVPQAQSPTCPRRRRSGAAT